MRKIWVTILCISFLLSLIVVISNLSSAPGGDLIIGDDESVYIVSGYEDWGNVTVLTTGRLIVPTGAMLNATNISLEGNSIVEITGGTVNLRNPNHAGDVRFNGTSGYFNLTNGANITIMGSDGYANTSSPGPYDAFLPISMGGDTEFNITVSYGVIIDNSSIYLHGGNGFDLPASTTNDINSWTSGLPLNGYEASGGNSSFRLTNSNPFKGMRINNSYIKIEGGRGGKAADGGFSQSSIRGKGGGYSNGGAVLGHVGVGGWASLEMFNLNNIIEIHESVIRIKGGTGGAAGNGGASDNVNSDGGGGGGYSGGDGGSGPAIPNGQNGGNVSDFVGCGGNGTIIIIGKDLSIDNSNISSDGGNGGDAGQGGNGGSGGGGGGGGFGGGGGGGYGGVSDTPNGGHVNVSGFVGSGAISTMIINISGDAVIEYSIISINGGHGGKAGNGGVRGQGGGGGGGFGGGGGGGDTNTVPGGNGGNPFVSGDVGRGGEAIMSAFISDKFVIYESNFSIKGGYGGGGGTGGNGSILIYPTGGGGGGYGGAGGAGNGDPEGGGGVSQLNGNIADGGKAFVTIECSDLFLSGSDAIQIDGGTGGNGPTSPGENPNGGDGLGRTTQNGTSTLLLPMSHPILKIPANESEITSIPITFEWHPVQNSSTNGPVINYSFEIDDDQDFSSPADSFVTALTNHTISTYIADGTYYWRVKAIYSTPEGSTAGWSETWEFTLSKPPEPVLLTPTEDEHISGIYNLTASSDPDTVSVTFYYQDGSWYSIGPSIYDAGSDTWFFEWDTSGLDLSNKRIMANATDSLGLYGNGVISGIEIDNTPPSPIILTPVENQSITGIYNITAVSDQDTVSAEFTYYDGSWHNIGLAQYDTYKKKWFISWNTTGLDLANITISINAIDEVGLQGSAAILNIEIDNTPPTPILLTPESEGHISLSYNLTAISDTDTVGVKFYYYDGSWHYIATGQYEPGSKKWYYNWSTHSLNIPSVNISVNATDEAGLMGNSSNTDIEIDNNDPDIIILTPQRNELIRGIYNLTAKSDPDTVLLDFTYEDNGTVQVIGKCAYDPSKDTWYYLWDTSNLNFQEMTIVVFAQDDAGVWGIEGIDGITIDNTVPSIISLTPSDNSEDVPVDTSITIEFSESIDIDNFTIDASIDPSTDIADYEWNANYTVLTMVLSSNLAQDTKYTITADIDARDPAGNHLELSQSWSFTTWLDTDNDGIPNNEDPDDDNDDVPDDEDYYPLDPDKWEEPFDVFPILILVLIVITPTFRTSMR